MKTGWRSKGRVSRLELIALLEAVNKKLGYERISFPAHRLRQVVFIEYYDNGIFRDTHVFHLPRKAKEFLVKILNGIK